MASPFLHPLGSQGLLVPRIGLGVMSAAFYGSGDPAADEAASLAAIDAYVALCTPHPAFLDTAYIYSSPTGLHSESIVAKAIAKHGRAAFVIATKFGSSQPPCSSREVIASQYSESVARLGTTPDLYYQHRPDPARPTAEVVADLAQMVAEGKFKYVGLSECTPAELRAAHAVHPISAIQMEYSLAERGIEASLLPVARVSAGQSCCAVHTHARPHSPLLHTSSLLTGAGCGHCGLQPARTWAAVCHAGQQGGPGSWRQAGAAAQV